MEIRGPRKGIETWIPSPVDTPPPETKEADFSFLQRPASHSTRQNPEKQRPQKDYSTFNYKQTTKPHTYAEWLTIYQRFLYYKKHKEQLALPMLILGTTRHTPSHHSDDIYTPEAFKKKLSSLTYFHVREEDINEFAYVLSGNIPREPGNKRAKKKRERKKRTNL